MQANNIETWGSRGWMVGVCVSRGECFNARVGDWVALVLEARGAERLLQGCYPATRQELLHHGQALSHTLGAVTNAHSHTQQSFSERKRGGGLGGGGGGDGGEERE